jgi:pimeloyl-ACP methyl ester carboxylesterase
MRLLLGALATVVAAASACGADGGAQQITGTTSSGAAWIADVPSHWNGTVLLWSRGYSPTSPPPSNAPASVRDALLARGYALLGSAYSAAGWSLEEAVPDQLATLDAFVSRIGKPRRVLAWGTSMGGLISVALTEQQPQCIHGGLALCSSIGGSVGMMNMALDGAFAFKTLISPDSAIRLVDTRDDRANARLVSEALVVAQATATGRARTALAGVLAGIPGWTHGIAAPAVDDPEAQQAQIAQSFVVGVFLPRSDQEARAGGNASWNTQVDYVQQLNLSGRRAMVEALYAKANLDLMADLRRLNAAPRISSQPHAVEYMLKNYTPTGRLKAPVLALQTIGDGMTSPSLQSAYIDLAIARSGATMAASIWSERAGHCNFPQAELLTSILALDDRVSTGRWNVDTDALNARARDLGFAEPAKFTNHSPPAMLRPCHDIAGRCPPIEMD